MGGACTRVKDNDVGHPRAIKDATRPISMNETNKTGNANDDLISIGSLKSRLTMKRTEGIGYYLVENVKKLEKDAKNVQKQWKNTLKVYEKEREKELRSEKIFSKKTDNVLLSLKRNKFNTFQALIETGIPLNLRWNVWKVQLFNESIYNGTLYEGLLRQEIDENYETVILKDLPRTFPQHEFFRSKDHTSTNQGGIAKLTSLNSGQRKLYNVLKAISIHMPNIGYTQGMNFVTGFLLMMCAGNESEAFWVFVLLARDPNFLFMGLFEEKLPLTHILIGIFEMKLKESLPALFEHFQLILLDSMLWVWKWFITVFLYSFPIEIVAKLWDYIVVNGGLSMVSLGLGIAAYYEKEFLKLDMEEMQRILNDFKDTNILLDIHSRFYLDFTKLRKLAKKYIITNEFASQCVKSLIQRKKVENIYTKFFVLKSQNEKHALEWINTSILERVKLQAADAIQHQGTVLEQSEEPNVILERAEVPDQVLEKAEKPIYIPDENDPMLDIPNLQTENQ